jgi:hypothetical protein
MKKILFDKLTEKDRERMLGIVKDLKAIEPQAKAILEDQKSDEAKLESVTSWDDFFAISKQIGQKSAGADKVLYGITQSMGTAVSAALNEHMQDDTALKIIWDSLHFNKSMSACITATKEKLSQKDLCEHFIGEKRDEVIKFLDGIKNIKPMEEVFKKQREKFSRELKDCSSMEQVNELEIRIDAHHNVANKIYNNEVISPVDEDVASAIMEYIEKNPPVQTLMQSFNFNELMTDDVLNAKARLALRVTP